MNSTKQAQLNVYYNLHKECYSIKYKGVVIAHCASVALHNASFHVSQAGRDRVVLEGRKNVHAYVRGTSVAFASMLDLTGKGDPTLLLPVNRSTNEYPFGRFRSAYYNPYKTRTFIDRNTGLALDKRYTVECLPGRHVNFATT